MVPSYNGAEFLPALCRSIQSQTFTDFEVLIGDDGSSDNTRQVLEPFLRDSRFRLIAWQPNNGLSRAVLTLLDRCRGRYWVAIAADDELKPAFMQQRFALMEKHPQVAMIHGPPELMDQSGKAIDEQSPLSGRVAENRAIYAALEREVPNVVKSADALRLLLTHNVISAPTIMVRMEVTRRILPYLQLNWRFAQDWYLWLLHAAAGASLAYDPAPLARYRLHANSMTYDPKRLALRRAEMRLVPLTALSVAAGFSFEAAVFWTRYRKPLYALWLRRALRLHQTGELKDEWLQMAATAYHGRGAGRVSLWPQVLRHAVSIGLAGLRENAGQRRLAFPVSGLAQLQNPFFTAANAGIPRGG